MLRKCIAVVLSFLMVISIIPFSIMASDITFDDMPDDWSKEAMEKAVSVGLIKGYDGKIRPNNNLSRGEMATIINRLLGTTDHEITNEFLDVSPTDWFYEEISKSVYMGIFEGFEGRMRPNDPITREEAFVILSRALSLDLGSSDNIKASYGFDDINDISHWAKSSVLRLIDLGYVKGSDGKINPKRLITRAEFAQLMDNIFKEYIFASGDKSVLINGSVIINIPDANLKDSIINGDLIIGDGATDGIIRLENVSVKGRILIRGGSKLIISNPKEIDLEDIFIVKKDGNINVLLDSDSNVSRIIINGSDNIVIEGNGKVEKVIARGKNIEVKILGAEVSAEEGSENIFAGYMRVNMGETIIVSMLYPPVFIGPIAPTGPFAGGTGTIENPYQVSTAEQLSKIRDYLDGNFIQIADIDLTDPLWSGEEGWIPIGDETEPFTGKYNGGNYEISGLKINRTDSEYQGLFGFIQESEIDNVNLSNIDVSGKRYIGGLAGYSRNSMVSDICVDGVISGNDRFIGGVIGFFEKGLLDNCSVTGNITGTSSSYSTGGIVGENRGTIQNISLDNIEVAGGNDVGGIAGRSYPFVDYGGSSRTITWFSDTGIVIDCSVGKNTSISGNMAVGGLIGDNSGGIPEYYGQVTRSSSYAVVQGNSRVGVVVGANSGKVFESYSNGYVTGDSEIGGLVGYNYGLIEDCYSLSEVNGNSKVGGLVGRNTDDIKNSYSSGKTTGTSYKGGFLGDFQSGTIVNSYWDVETSTQPELSYYTGLTGYNTAQMIKETNSVEIYTDWNYNDTWTIIEGESYPYFIWQESENIPYPVNPFAGGKGTLSDPYQIETAEQLNAIRNYLNANFVQIEDINLDASPWNENEGWVPIGSYSNPFRGTFDGDNYNITGLTINRPTERYQGLFGVTNTGASLSNIKMESPDILADEYIGSLVGINGANIINCSAINVDIKGDESYVGGLLGQNTGAISNSFTTGMVKADYSTVGGLIGYNYNNVGLGYIASVQNCYSEANVSYYMITNNELESAGGLVGYNSGGTISDSYAIGDVTAHESAGGLVGENFQGIISNCFALGNVIGVSDYNGYTSYYVGGLVGENGYMSQILNSFSEGLVSGYHNVGGLVGYNSSVIENSRSSSIASGYDKIGGLVGDNSGTIINSNANGNVSGSSYLGGLAGYSSYGVIQGCYSTGNVTGGATAGGLMGSIQTSTVINSYATGNVIGSGEVGGLSGYVSVSARIENCYSVGTVSGTGSLGGLVGAIYDIPSDPDKKGLVINSYYNQETSGRSDNTKGTPLTTANMLLESSYVSWDFINNWVIEEGISYPYLRDNIQSPKPQPSIIDK